MIHYAFVLMVDGNGLPYIKKVEYTNPDGVSWREAKKQLRQWYLDQAGAIRGLTEVTYFVEADVDENAAVLAQLDQAQA